MHQGKHEACGHHLIASLQQCHIQWLLGTVYVANELGCFMENNVYCTILKAIPHKEILSVYHVPDTQPLVKLKDVVEPWPVSRWDQSPWPVCG